VQYVRPMSRRVVVIGAGFSGTAVAIALLRRSTGPISITLVERSGSFGPGIAYATSDPRHLLNVPAGSMSAIDGEPDHLLEWAHRRGIAADKESYLARGVYGEYLRDLLPNDRLRRETDEVVGIDGSTVLTRGGLRLAADAIVLAAGISTPLDPGPVAAVADHPGYLADPWDQAAVTALAPRRRVLIVGTGLTMVDIALSLSDAPGREILAISRHGELARSHRADAGDPGEPAVRPGDHDTVTAIVAQVERRARETRDWRGAIDSLRPVTQQLWRELPLTQKAIFLEEHSRRWEVHRSRMAPEVAARVRALRRDGRLRVAAGAVDDVRPAGDRIAVDAGGERVLVDGFVNATGPAWDCRHGDSDLIRALLAAGTVTPGPLGLGLHTTAGGAVIDRDGRASERLFTLGALRRGELWETIAVPELREQATAIAERLAA
jgi:uncharacterized NAD(P)/FAD-binding protein YdhS